MLKCLNLISSSSPFNYRKTHLINVPKKLIYGTVLDIPSYSRFLPWCEKSHWIDDVVPSEPLICRGQRRAQLTVNFKLLKESYVSKVTFEPFSSVRAVAADSNLFETLDTVWEFEEQGNNTLIKFYIIFKFHFGAYQSISASLGRMLTDTMLERFVKECHRRHNTRILS
ncbi:coenzyme Q-binding COQ10 homolog mitochondrial-like protein, putative [Babesia ovata]|uniref:Coenzyme Q-binding COQ10 homolog mitochondrial-like protein, putative n=1 Tax=Babesia ovata TaxID=189622 RepID=A0A2H6KI97_9APIC|nr:coenzyme Q-binding COQ10 homolog mitochondrial-like protein, putative [Babesia ovata]GBE62717.1 coenzyme Q-binding COQ10 homolog mitochondrial-like protein, putative [Babesia ovata]